MDPKVNGQMQHDWSWLIAVYLFLGGIAGGAYVIAAINSFLGDGLVLSTTIGLWIAFPALAIGTLFLMADLGSPRHAVLSAMKPGTSWISRGTIVISVFMAISFIHLVIRQFTSFGDTAGGQTIMNILSVLGIIFAVGTMAYTGILLGASKGIPFWRSGAVPVVFVISALVTGHFAIMLGVALLADAASIFANASTVAEAIRVMALEAAVLVAVEVLAIAFFLQGALSHPDPRESAHRILHKRMFVWGYFILGLGVPLVLMILAYRSTGDMDQLLGPVIVGALLGLSGGLILRQAVLICGALPTLNIAGFEFRRIHRPKEPKAKMGLLPPA